jgi:transcriptional regulator with XRE-family HTH domain
MENIGDAWHRATAERIGKAVARYRKDAHLTAQQLAERCRELGAPIHRTTITKIEGGRSRFDLGEWLILAGALGVPPIALLYPDLPDGQVEMVPGKLVKSYVGYTWVTGLMAFARDEREVSKASQLVDAARERYDLMAQLAVLHWEIRETSDDVLRKSLESQVPRYRDRIERLNTMIRECGGVLEE